MTDVAARVETHEADMWARMAAATGAVGSDPLGARVDRSGRVPLFALMALNVPLFNRVVSLGVAEPADDAEIDRPRVASSTPGSGRRRRGGVRRSSRSSRPPSDAFVDVSGVGVPGQGIVINPGPRGADPPAPDCR